MTLRLTGPAFVGRGRELAELRQALSAGPAVVLVEGEAGIGKTRLVRELLAVAGLRALVAGCPPLREPFTLGPLLDAVRTATDDPGSLRLTSLAGALRPFLPEWSDQLPPAPEQLGDVAAAKHRLFRALAELLNALAIELLVVDDSHWADDTTLEFLLFLQSRQFGDRQVPSVLVTYRPEDVPAGSLLPRLGSRQPAGAGHLRLTLGSLDPGQTAELVSSMLDGGAVSERFAEFLHDRTEGVPLAIEELVRLMHDRADLITRDGEWIRRQLDKIVVPPTIRDAVLERVARLAPDTQLVLRAAAVLTHPADEPTLAVVGDLPPDRAADALDAATDAGLFQRLGGRQVAFRHVLTSWAVYESMPAALRRSMHRRSGDLLERLSPPPAARLAWHFREAGDARWRKYAEEAADTGIAAGAASEAVGLLHDLIVSGHLPATDLVRLMNKMPYFTPRRAPELVGAIRTALDGDLDPATRSALRFQLGHALIKLQEYGAGREELRQALPGLADDPQRAVRAMVLLGWPLDGVEHASVHLDWLRQAAAILPPPGSPERARLDQDRASALLFLGDPSGWDVAAALPVDGTTHQVRRIIASGHVNLSHQETVWGRYRDARRRIAVAAELVGEGDMRDLEGMIAVNSVHLDLFTGEWKDLAERAEVLAGNEDLLPMGRIEAELVREQLRLAVDPAGTEDERMAGLLAGSLRHGAVPEMMEPAAALARIRLAAGRPGDALEVTERPIQIIERTQIWIWATELAPARVEALVCLGRVREAAALTEAFAAGLGDLDAPAPQAALTLCRAVIAEAVGDSSAAAAFERAAEAFGQLPRPYEALLARERQGRCLLRSGPSEDAVGILATAFEDLTTLGARAAAARVAEVLRQQGAEVSTPWRGGRRGYGDELSPREVDVVRLVVRGQTNRQIASALFLSHKTVARHLNSAMRKLGVTSRTAVAVRAIETGILPPG